MSKISIFRATCIFLCSGLFLGYFVIYKKGQQPSFAPNLDFQISVQHFLSTLSASQKEIAVYQFSQEERFNWFYTPVPRKGIPLRSLDQSQREAALQVLQVSLSEKGFAKAREIMELEVILKEVEARKPADDYRHPEKYYFTVFGDPAGIDPWGWRIEGHHLSLNYSALSGKLISATPSFFGSNPAVVPSGPYKGKQILKQEEQLGFQLLNSLSEVQKKLVLIQENAPSDIITTNKRKANMEARIGLPAKQMTDAQRKILRELIEVYRGNQRPDVQKKWEQLIEKGGFDSLHFAWAGAFETKKGHYYRIHGPYFLIEYDNTQNNANHVHSVVRDLENDFGEDILAKHYQEHRH